MKKTNRRRIALGRETVKHLTSASLQHIAGGATNLSRPSQCDCPTAGGCGPDTLTLSALGTTCTITKEGDCDF